MSYIDVNKNIEITYFDAKELIKALKIKKRVLKELGLKPDWETENLLEKLIAHQKAFTI